MSKYRAGQRVRIEWKNGSVVEGVLERDRDGATLSVIVPRAGAERTMWQPDFEDGRVVTILSEPRPEEPTGLGAVVEAYEYPGSPLRRWVRTEYENSPWVFPGHSSKWANLIDPVVLSQGWTADE